MLSKIWCAGVLALAVSTCVSAQSSEVFETEIALGNEGTFLQLFINTVTNFPVPGQTTIEINTISNEFIVGFIIFVGDGDDPTNADVLSLSGPSTTFGGVVNIMGEIIGGSSNDMMDPPLPVIIATQCDTVMECEMLTAADATPVLTIVILTPDNGNVVVSGPGEDDQPVFDVPAPIGPSTATILSDPHFMGFSEGVQYDFTGVPGRFYSIISDQDLAVNAQFGQAWRTGLFTDPDTLLTVPMYTEGTWMSSVGILINGHTIKFSTQESSLADLCPSDRTSACFVGGTIEIDGSGVIHLGNAVVNKGTGLSVELKNSKSFGRMTVTSPRIMMELDYVSPPKSWAIEQQNADSYSHINLGINRIMLTESAHGVLGQTRRQVIRDGEVIKTSDDKDGKGLLDGIATDYELPTLFSTDFKYSNY